MRGLASQQKNQGKTHTVNRDDTQVKHDDATCISASVSVLTIKGTECDLLHLGQVADQSGGYVI